MHWREVEQSLNREGQDGYGFLVYVVVQGSVTY